MVAVTFIGPGDLESHLGEDAEHHLVGHDHRVHVVRHGVVEVEGQQGDPVRFEVSADVAHGGGHVVAMVQRVDRHHHVGTTSEITNIGLAGYGVHLCGTVEVAERNLRQEPVCQRLHYDDLDVLEPQRAESTACSDVEHGLPSPRPAIETKRQPVGLHSRPPTVSLPR